MARIVNDLKQLGLRLRPVLETDLKQMDLFCKSVDFDIGLANIRIYFNTSHQFWKLVEEIETGKIVAIDLANILNNKISMVYGYITLVHKDYRSKGLTKFFTVHWKNHPVMGSASQFYMQRLKTEVWLEKRLSINGSVKPSDFPTIVLEPTDIIIRTADMGDFQKVFDYDNDIIKLDRSHFLKQWSFSFEDQSETKTVIALKNNTCIGYGTVRRFSSYYGIHPLYADTSTIAVSILGKLVSFLSPHSNFYLSILANRPQLMACINALGMKITGTELRHCTRSCMPYVQQILTDKAYVVHEFWPL